MPPGATDAVSASEILTGGSLDGPADGYYDYVYFQCSEMETWLVQ